MEESFELSSKVPYEFNRIPNSGLQLETAYDEWFAVTRKGIHIDQKPKLINHSIECPTRIENVTTIMFDGTSELYANNQSDPIFLALFPSQDPTTNPKISLLHSQFISSRNSLRKLANVLITPYLSEKVNSNRFYTAVKDFTLHLEKIHSMTILQNGERWTVLPGGYGAGLERLLTRQNETVFRKPSSKTKPAVIDEAVNEDTFDINCYRLRLFTLGSCHLLIKNEVDAIDKANHSIEIKSTKVNPRYGISTEYYLNVWIQNFLGNTFQTKLGTHDGKGNIDSILSLSMNELQRLAQVTPEMKTALLEHLEDLLVWIRNEVPNDHQAILHYTASTNSFELEIFVDHRLPIISSDIRNLLKEASISV